MPDTASICSASTTTVRFPEWEDLPADYFDRLTSMPGVELDDDLFLETMGQVAEYLDEFRKTFPMEKTKDSRQFHLIKRRLHGSGRPRTSRPRARCRTPTSRASPTLP